MFEQNNTQQQSRVILNGEGSSNSLPPSGCIAINTGTPDSMTAFQVPIYPTAGMPYVQSPPMQLPETPPELQQMGSPLFSQGYPMPYPVGFPTSYGSFPYTLQMPWNGGSDSQPSKGNAPRTWRKVSKMQVRSNAKTQYSSSRRLPSRYVRHKENRCNSYIRKNSSNVTTSSDGYSSTNTNIEENIHANPEVTTAVSSSNFFDNQVTHTVGSEQPLSTSVTCTNSRYGQISAWNSWTSYESRERYNNCQEIRVEGQDNCPAGPASHRIDYPSQSSRHNVEVIDIADENPTGNRACDTLLSSATSPPTPRSYPNVLHRISTDPRRRRGVEQTSRKSVESFPGRVQDPLLWNSFLKPSTAVVNKEAGTRTNQRTEARKALSNHGANPETVIPIRNTTGEVRSREIRSRIVCSLCWKVFPTVEERFFHYGKIHHLCLSSLDIHVPLINTSNPADVGYLKGLGIEKCIPLDRKESGRELAIPIINIDDKGHLINLLESWNAADVLDLGPIKGRAYT